MHYIKKVKYLDGFRLELTFNDNKKKIVDLKKYSKEGPKTVFYPFRDMEFFKSVKVDQHTGTIIWPNGVDLCPDVLYEMGVMVKDSEKNVPRKKAIGTPSASARSKTRIVAKPKH